jgi:hypothetical protein
MSDSSRTAQPFAYVLIVEADDAMRDLILQTVRAPNCAVDVARDEDEAVTKAVQHRPRLIIVKQHSPLHLDELQPPPVSIASRICRRARLSRAVRLVTHSDAAITLRWHIWPSARTFSDNRCTIERVPMGRQRFARRKVTFSDNHCISARPVFESQQWRKEWYSYSTCDVALKFLSGHLRFWLDVPQPAPSLYLISPILRLPQTIDRFSLNLN